MHIAKALVIDSQPIMREAIGNIIHDLSASTQVYQSASSSFGLQIINNHSVDLVILDIDLDGSDGFEFARRSRAHGYKGKILFISANQHPMYSNTARQLGANGYITKTESTAMLKEAIVSVSRGFTVFKNDEGTKNRRHTKLSKRETIVFNYLLKGYTNKQISEILSLSSKTISTYKSRILEKYKVDSIVELMRLQQHVDVDTVELKKDAA
ncbi:response regulator [Vibrio sp. TBV020]|uniref:response regulator n=1 Tax=Vibrio sp. TBV020 TaxID=3137398 RepID=UPI0038CD49EE